MGKMEGGIGSIRGKAVWRLEVERRKVGGDEEKRAEERTQVSNHLPGEKKCSYGYSSKRQGQHWWSELFVFLLTSFIPNEMCNQSDAVLLKHFIPHRPTRPPSPPPPTSTSSDSQLIPQHQETNCESIFHQPFTKKHNYLKKCAEITNRIFSVC